MALPASCAPDQLPGIFPGLPVLLVDGDGDEDGPPGVTQAAAAVLPVSAPEANTAAGRLRWEQLALPHLVRQVQARLVHTTTLSPPLFSAAPCVVSPAELLATAGPPAGLRARLREALGRGGLAGARAILWPADLPQPGFSAPVFRLPPVAHSAFFQQQPGEMDLPGPYLLVTGPFTESSAEMAAAVWSWTSAGLGDGWTILVCDAGQRAAEEISRLCRASGIETPVETIVPGNPSEWALVFQQASAVLLAGPVLPWGDASLGALACACLLAGEETPWASARVGPGGYLAPPGDARALGAAVITPLVEEVVAEQLRQAAQERSSSWRSAIFGQELTQVYRQVAQDG